jgi:hypothetical protein
VPRGLNKIAQLAADAKAKQDAYDSGEGFSRSLYLKAGATCKGRFLEEGDGVWYVYTHDLPKKAGQAYADKVLCLDQPLNAAEANTYQEGSRDCHACGIEGVRRQTRVVINLLRYDEPKLLRDAKGKAVKENGQVKVIGVEPQVVVCNLPQMAGGRLAYLESQRGPLTKHVCTLHKTGDKNNPWMIDILETKDPEPFERELYEKKIEAIEAIKTARFGLPQLSIGDMRRAYGGAATAAGFQGGGDQPNGQGGQETNVYQQAADSAAGHGHINRGAFS